jgi:Pre ATP-grasp domain/PGM1 C-terminal domain
VTTLHIANSRTDDMVGDLAALTERDRAMAGAIAQRVVWFAQDRDILVVPGPPDDDYVGYVAGLTGTDAATLRFLVPRPGDLGADLLTPDRLAGAEFLARVRTALADRRVERVAPIYTDQAVAEFAGAAGVRDALPGHGFHAQGGTTLVNSKAVFRAVAAGTGAAVAPGAVVTRRADAVAAIEVLLRAGHAVIVKQEFHSGGEGNDLLSRTGDERPIGVRQVVHAPGRDMVEHYVTREWDRLTGHRHRALVVERYYPESVPVFVEFLVTDDGVEPLGDGQLTMNPTLDGVITPAVVLTSREATRLAVMGRRLCEPYRRMGYRGVLTPDAILTQDRELLLSEMNGRISGATHHFTGIARSVGGRARMRDRVLVEHEHSWGLPSFGAAVERLAAAGLAFDPARRAGVVLVDDLTAVDGTVRHCVVAEDQVAAAACEREIAALAAGAEGAR